MGNNGSNSSSTTTTTTTTTTSNSSSGRVLTSTRSNVNKSKAEDHFMLLADTNAEIYNYILVSCFTGWGTASVQTLDEYHSSVPNISTCESLYPNGSEYALDTLQTAVDAHNAANGKKKAKSE